MKMCAHHWDKLRQGVKDRGIDHLVAKSGAEACERLVNDLGGDKDINNYDPLMDANFMIISKALEQGGIYLMSLDAAGEEYCPLCEVNRIGGEGVTADGWIKGCLDSILNFCKEKKLLATAH